MNKYELICRIAESSGITKVAAEKTLNSTLDAITNALTKDEVVSLVGFGAFSVANRAARIARNPHTGEEIPIAEKKVVKFKVGKKLKDSVCIKGKAKTGCGCKASKAKGKQQD